MKIFRITPFLLFLLMGLAGPVAVADSAIPQIAGIVVNLHHYPSDAEKQTLRGIADNTSSSAGERTLATALMNMEHKVSAADRQKLEELVKAEGTPADERTLAEILMSINHKPSAADVKKLGQLAGN